MGTIAFANLSNFLLAPVARQSVGKFCASTEVTVKMNRYFKQISDALYILFLIGACLICSGFLWQNASAQDHVLVLSGGTLIDGTGKNAVKDAVVVIRGNRIEKVGSRRQLQIPQGAELVDTSNQFILPGLIESHFHYAPWMPGELWLSFGVTSAVNYGKAISQAAPPETSRWPRIFFAGEQVAGPEGMTDLGKVLETGNYTRPEQAHDIVQARKAEGATFIKISENLSGELIAALTKEAHQVALPVIGHQVNARDAVRAGLDGVEHMTGLALAAVKDPAVRSRLAEISRTKGPSQAPISHHISDPEYYMDMNDARDILKLMVKQHAYLNPTLVTRWQRVEPRTDEFAQQYKKISEDPYWSSIPENVRKSWTNTLMPYPEWPDAEHKQQEKEGYRKAQQLLHEFTQMGGKIFSGTDVAGASVPGLRLHQELQLLVDAGLTPMQVILTTTRYPAEIYKVDKNLGTVEAGKLADLLVVEADPLQDIRNLSRIRSVILDGKVVPTKFQPDTIIRHQ